MAGKVAVVTGSNKGLGFAVVKALCQKFKGSVYLTSRDEVRGLEAVKNLNNIGLNPLYHILDVTDENSVKTFADYLKKQHGGLDVIVNNAGIMDLGNLYPNYEDAKKNIECNYKSLLYIEKYMFPLLRDGAKVVNVSSACGHLSNLKKKEWIQKLSKEDLSVDDVNDFVNNYLDSLKNGTFDKNDFVDEGIHAEHRVSKIAVTALTIIQANKYKNISVNAVHPGHVKTDMAKGGGKLEADDAVKNIMYLIFDASPNLSGTFLWHDGKLVDWYDYESDYYYKQCDH